MFSHHAFYLFLIIIYVSIYSNLLKRFLACSALYYSTCQALICDLWVMYAHPCKVQHRRLAYLSLRRGAVGMIWTVTETAKGMLYRLAALVYELWSTQASVGRLHLFKTIRHHKSQQSSQGWRSSYPMLLCGLPLNPWRFNTVFTVVLRFFPCRKIVKTFVQLWHFWHQLLFTVNTGRSPATFIFFDLFRNEADVWKAFFNIAADSRLHDGTGQAAVPLLEKTKIYIFLVIHCKKMLAVFPSPAGMSLTKLWPGIIFIFPGQGELDIPAGDGNHSSFFIAYLQLFY